jgi:glutamate synthase domain-containing protein 2/glutamate synthase domain-containing protein 1/glutamate synthase domain-containing protein 3
MIVDLSGVASADLVTSALDLVAHLAHRGATCADPSTGDGAGILLGIPDRLLRRELAATGLALPPGGTYGVGQFFLPRSRAAQAVAHDLTTREAGAAGFRILAWRRVPTTPDAIGEVARRSAPVVEQVFLTPKSCYEHHGDEALERCLYRLRRRLERALSDIPGAYICSLSSRTVVYKGMLTAGQLGHFYPDLMSPAAASAIALVHARFSTNTLPSWALAQPFRVLAHNGEINTLDGNLAGVRARRSLMKGGALGPAGLTDVGPIVTPGGSDSGTLDEVLEFHVQAGYTTAHALSMLIPPAWQGRDDLRPQLRDFFTYNACLTEPWDGPAALVFTDGVIAGASLDRNGLRPSRWARTDDGWLVLSSEAGALPLDPDRVIARGRLGPGQILLADPQQGRVLEDEEVRTRLARQRPYGEWLSSGIRHLSTASPRLVLEEPHPAALQTEQRIHGWGAEDLKRVLVPMARHGKPPVGSMGKDTPLAVLSERRPSLFDYMKQRFAQVTNPPLDSLRERAVMSLEVLLGAQGDPLNPGPTSCHRLRLVSPVLDQRSFEALRALDDPGLPLLSFSLAYPIGEGTKGLVKNLEDLGDAACDAVRDGARILVLSDSAWDATRGPTPSLLAVSALHHRLIEEGLRAHCGLVLDTGEAREVHHLAALIGFGADAVHPRLALQTVRSLAAAGELDGSPEGAAASLVSAFELGLLKVMAKLGIADVRAYQGAQLFEALGISRQMVARFFPGTPTRIGGLDTARLAAELAERHAAALDPAVSGELTDQGLYRWRRKGEDHALTPAALRALHRAVRENDLAGYREYASLVERRDANRLTIRSLLEFRPPETALDLDSVEPADDLVRRFSTSAMSYGSISQEAHETLAVAMNQMGARSNSGEGGEDPSRDAPGRDGSSRRSATRQVASGRFGVTASYLVQADELQIKMAQGAKPGEGGQLPAHKVHPWIARTRSVEPWTELISPPPHHDIYSIEDLAQLIHDLRSVNPQAEIAVKLASGVGVGTIAAGVVKAGADRVVISGGDGGTGAAALGSIHHAGSPWELGLAETHQTLVTNGLREGVRLQVDGGLRTGRDVVVASSLGADEFGFGTAALLATGCIMRRVCHEGSCPVGIATQDPKLRARYPGEPEHVIRFMHFVAEEARKLLAHLGVADLTTFRGRTDLLQVGEEARMTGLDLSILLLVPEPHEGTSLGARRPPPSPTRLERAVSRAAEPALQGGQPVHWRGSVENTDRSVGTRLGGEVMRRTRGAGLPQDSVILDLEGAAGQSLGAFLPQGVTLRLAGQANDGVGKGLSGGRLVIVPPGVALARRPGGSNDRPSSMAVTLEGPADVLIGNAALYGATGGEFFLRGAAGERFGVRNSGAMAVVEGVGDHAFEYMTAGKALVLGPSGANLAAGMRGGVLFCLDLDGNLRNKLTDPRLGSAPLHPALLGELRELLERHLQATGSPRAARVLADLPHWQHGFLQVGLLPEKERSLY